MLIKNILPVDIHLKLKKKKKSVYSEGNIDFC